MNKVFKRLLAWLNPPPPVYAPWDVRSGPEVFCNWMATGKDIRKPVNTEEPRG